MKHKVMNTAFYMIPEARALLEENGCEVLDDSLEKMTEEGMCKAIQGIEAVIASGEYWTEKVFDSADKLKIVARTGAGVDRVNLDAAAQRGIWVTNTPGATSHAVADLTIGLMLSLLRNIPAMTQDMKNGIWKQHQGRELGSMTVGVVGAGGIGREVIKRLRGFGSRVLAYDIMKDEAFAREYQAQYVDLDELMRSSDMISVNLSLNDQTRGIINSQRLDMMKKNAYLVNTSRPQVIDCEALLRKLKNKEIAGAALDVHDPVPCRPDDPLVLQENVIATPWVAYRTDESIARMCMAAAADVAAVMRGEKPKFPVNRPVMQSTTMAAAKS